MTYLGIDKGRFETLLKLGTDDEELRNFFVDCRAQLIQKGAKVQNLPHGNPARVRMLVQGLPQATDRVLQKWFSTNLTVTDPISYEELVNTFREYEEAGDQLPESDSRPVARSCLFHLFSSSPPPDLIAFLKPSSGSALPPEITDAVSQSTPIEEVQQFLPALAMMLVAVFEGKDPDEYLANLPAAVAATVALLHAINSDRKSELNGLRDALSDQVKVKEIIDEYARRRANALKNSDNGPAGVRVTSLAPYVDDIVFDQDKDEVLGICTKSTSPRAVFVRPFALRKGGI